MLADNPELKITAPAPPPAPLKIHSQESLLLVMIEEQRKTNELLAALVDALAEDSGDPDAPPAYYMDGTPVRG